MNSLEINHQLGAKDKESFAQRVQREVLLKWYKENDLTAPQFDLVQNSARKDIFNAVFNEGIRMLKDEVSALGFEKRLRGLGYEVNSGGEKLRDILKIDILKKELMQARLFGNKDIVLQKELEIFRKIQNAIGILPGDNNHENISAKTLRINGLRCLGSSILAGAFFKEIGINYLQANNRRHAFILLVTANEEVYLDDPILGDGCKGKLGDVDSKNVIAFSKSLKAEGILINLPLKEFGKSSFSCVFDPRKGQEIMFLSMVGNSLLGSGQKEESIEIFRHALRDNPMYPRGYIMLGNAFLASNRYDEALQVYNQAVILDPNYPSSYYGLGNAWYSKGDFAQALSAYRKFIEIADEVRDRRNILLAKAMMYHITSEIE